MAETKGGIETADRDEEGRRRKFSLVGSNDGGSTGLEVQYRAVLLEGFTEPKKVVKVRSEWVYDKKLAEEIVDSYKPFTDGWGGTFYGYIEQKGWCEP